MIDSDTTNLLRAVFPHATTGEPAYLRWLYRESPFGPVVEANLDDETGRAGHYAVVPLTLATRSGPVLAALSLNTAVHERVRGAGVFTRLAQEALTEAANRGIRAVLGVANANSTPGFVRRLGFTQLGPLPASVLVPQPSRRAVAIATSDVAGTAIIGDPDAAAILGRVAAETGEGTHRVWTPEALAWRLAAPDRPYLLHRGDDILAVSASDRTGPVPVAVILGVFTSHVLAPSERQALVRAACRAHRAPVALHVGHNRHAPFGGVAVPDRLRPSPLNLVFRWLDQTQVSAPSFDRFELLDFDAY